MFLVPAAAVVVAAAVVIASSRSPPPPLQVLSITGHIHDERNTVSVEDHASDAASDYSDFNRGS
jgi:hypothetical protein